MIKNYFIIGWRNIQRNKWYTFVNITGLAFGFAVFIAALLYVNYETDYDSWNKQLDRVYRVAITEQNGGETSDNIGTPYPLGTQLLSTCPEVQAVTRIVDKGDCLISSGEKQLYVNKVISADSSFFTVFPYKFIYGSHKAALDQPSQAVISYAFSVKMFGKGDPVGKTFKLDAKKIYTVAGVFEKTGSSHLDFNICLSYFNKNPGDWGRQFFFTYVLLRPNISLAGLSEKAQKILVGGELSYYSGVFKNDPKVETPGNNAEQWLQKHAMIAINSVFFENVANIHLHPKASAYRNAEQNNPLIDASPANNSAVMFFSLSALMVLVLACINYINLSVARSGKRAKESGVRKVMGARRGQLILQFMVESFIQSFAALLIGLFLAKGLIYFINEAFNLRLTFVNHEMPLQNMWLAIQLLIILVFVSLFSGAYPAFVLSAFKPAKVLKNQLTQSFFKGKFLLNGLVVLQFGISTCFIIGMLIVYKQLSFMNSNDPGFSTNQVLVLKPNNTSLISLRSKDQKTDMIRTGLLNLPGVSSVAMTDAFPGSPSLDQQDALSNNRQLKMTFNYINFGYFKTLDMKIADGRDFSTSYSTDSTNAAVINETAAKEIGFKNALGKKVNILNRDYYIIGVLHDNHIAGYNAKIGPEIYTIGTDPGPNLGYSSVLVKLNGRQAQGTLKLINKFWKDVEPTFPLRYSWLDDDFAKLLDKYERFGKMTILLSAVSTFIAIMGIFALSTFAAAQRTKEIGIRKIFGASVINVTAMLSKDFMRLVFIALVVAFPFAYYAADKWLQQFAYRTGLNGFVFLSAGLLIISIALVTVSFQAIKAALANPAKSLKTE